MSERPSTRDYFLERHPRQPVDAIDLPLPDSHIDSDTVTVYNCAMNTNAQPLLTIDDLAAQADVPIRTVRFYIAEGLLPGASTRGKGASYTQEHLDRLQLIRLLVARHLPLAEIHALVTRLPPGEVRAVLQEEQARTGEISAHASKPSSPKDYLTALLDQARGYPGHGHSGGISGISGISGSGGAGSRARRLREAQQAHSPSLPVLPAQSLTAQTREHEQATPVLWQRWELAPGIELQVRAGVAQTRQEVIDRVLHAVREALANGSVDNQQEE